MKLVFVVVVATGCGFQPHTSTDAMIGDGAGSNCTAELCNGLDDDCDGMIDEDFTLGMACDGSDADQCTDGHVVCSPDGTATACNDDPAAIVEICTDAVDNDCNGFADCQDGPACCSNAACSGGAYCCTGTGQIATIGNTCLNDFGSTSSSDSMEIYCCNGIARFCLSGEACPWRAGCGATTTTATCSRSGLSSDLMATATCQLWHGQTTYSCSVAEHMYFP